MLRGRQGSCCREPFGHQKQSDLSKRTAAGWLLRQGDNVLPSNSRSNGLKTWLMPGPACSFLQCCLHQQSIGKYQSPAGHHDHSLPAVLQMLLPEHAVRVDKASKDICREVATEQSTCMLGSHRKMMLNNVCLQLYASISVAAQVQSANRIQSSGGRQLLLP